MDLLNIPLIMAVVELVKRTFDVESKYIPLLTLILSIIIASVGLGLTKTALINGFITGLSASGLYSGIKNTVRKD